MKYIPASTGGLLAEKLHVDANIPLRPGSPGYDPTKVDSLVNAAVAYAKQGGYDCEFWSTD